MTDDSLLGVIRAVKC